MTAVVASTFQADRCPAAPLVIFFWLYVVFFALNVALAVYLQCRFSCGYNRRSAFMRWADPGALVAGVVVLLEIVYAITMYFVLPACPPSLI